MGMGLSDQSIPCGDCDAPFTFTVAEQVFYAERGFRRPICCPECRARKRAERNADAIKACESAAASLLWNDGLNTFRGHAANGAISARRGGRPQPRPMHRALCSACGKSAEVPFEPRGSRPVYCRDCFNARRGR